MKIELNKRCDICIAPLKLLKPKLIAIKHKDGFSVMCPKCKNMTYKLKPTIEEAIDEWDENIDFIKFVI